jgi:hypothetical protein
MTAIDWRVPINEILFGLNFTEEITDKTVRWNADRTVNYPLFDLGPEVYYRAIAPVARSGAMLA